MIILERLYVLDEYISQLYNSYYQCFKPYFNNLFRFLLTLHLSNFIIKK